MNPAARPLIRVVGVVALLLLLITILVGPSQPLPHGAAAPAARGRTVDGVVVDVADWKGKLVFVNVLGTWCAPCLKEMPDLVIASQKWGDVRFVGLAVDSPP